MPRHADSHGGGDRIRDPDPQQVPPEVEHRGSARGGGRSRGGGGAWPLVVDKHFILATRDTGYRSVAAALSELIDNALQAGAKIVQVLIREEQVKDASSDRARRRLSLAVTDDGSGMDAAEMRTALQFGGSARFNDRGGSGRFGMGLPNSSVSQSRRVELYSWRNGRAPLFTNLDVNEIAEGRPFEIPEPARRDPPEWVLAALGENGRDLSGSGTVVVWPECDRLPFRKASTARHRLCEALGTTYRYPLRDGIRIYVDGHPVEPRDHLMEWGKTLERYGVAARFGDELRYEFKVPTDPHRTSVVRVRFSLLPVRKWARLPLDVRKSLGAIGGAGVSIVRAGREVDRGWYLLGSKRRENYDDWWRCEVRFEPELDEYFGITHSKQGITPHPSLRDVVSPDLERIARLLNARVRREFMGAAEHATTRARPGRSHSTADLAATDRRTLTIAIARERFLPPLAKRLRGFRVEHAPLASPRFFVAGFDRGYLGITINTDHPAYAALVAADAASRDVINFVIVAAARAELSTRFARAALRTTSCRAVHRAPDSVAVESLDDFLGGWSDALASYLSHRA